MNAMAKIQSPFPICSWIFFVFVSGKKQRSLSKRKKIVERRTIKSAPFSSTLHFSLFHFISTLLPPSLPLSPSYSNPLRIDKRGRPSSLSNLLTRPLPLPSSLDRLNVSPDSTFSLSTLLHSNPLLFDPNRNRESESVVSFPPHTRLTPLGNNPLFVPWERREEDKLETFLRTFCRRVSHMNSISEIELNWVRSKRNARAWPKIVAIAEDVNFTCQRRKIFQSTRKPQRLLLDCLFYCEQSQSTFLVF